MNMGESKDKAGLSNKAGSKDKKAGSVPEGFTVGMAAMDALPVLFFSGSAAVLSSRFPSGLFRTGVCIVILAGALKVLWKFIIAIAHRSISILNRQMRFLMPAGFLLAVTALFVDRKAWSLSAVLAHMMSFPSILFFIASAAGMVCMAIFSRIFSGMDVRANWIEQWTNTIAQSCIFLGILL